MLTSTAEFSSKNQMMCTYTNTQNLKNPQQIHLSVTCTMHTTRPGNRIMGHSKPSSAATALYTVHNVIGIPVRRSITLNRKIHAIIGNKN